MIVLSAADQQTFLSQQAPAHPDWGGTGAVYRPPDPEDRSMLLLPGIAQGVHAGVSAASLLQYVTGPSYNQGPTSACVAASSAGVGSIDAAMNGQAWPEFSWQTLYAENGGTGQNGVDSQAVLKDIIANGLPKADGTRVKELATYLWAPQTPGLFRQTLLAALAAGHVCTLALLLPSQFGWNSAGARTQGYHQVVLAAGDPTWAIILNSWGDQWPSDGAPRGGLGRIPWNYIEADNLQNGYAFAYLTTRLQIGPAPPLPPPGPVPLPPVPPPTPTPAGIIVRVSAPPAYHGGIVFAQLSETNGQYLPPGSRVAVSVTAPDGRTGQGGVVL